MNRSLLLHCLFLLLTFNGLAQSNAGFISLDHNKKTCKTGQATYFRKVLKQGDVWHVEDYYADNSKEEMEVTTWMLN